MQTEKPTLVTAEKRLLSSTLLRRVVVLHIYSCAPKLPHHNLPLLLINDGQDLDQMKFKTILSDLYHSHEIEPVFFVGIECGPKRTSEYATAKYLDFEGRGADAPVYQLFILTELLPYLHLHYTGWLSNEKSICGFSMGGLSAMDIAWNHPHEFKNLGVFSGSFWWRLLSQDDPRFNEENDRIMHLQIRGGQHVSGLKFFFEAGALDETADRNHNGVIDSVDDTRDLIKELVKKGYALGRDIQYLELKDGRHDVPTWGKAFPKFLKWAWGNHR